MAHGTPWNKPVPTFSDQYYDQPYLGFAGVQTGHNGGHLDWCAQHSIEWNLHLYRHEPHKPVFNLEAMYDARGTNGWRAIDARSLGWRTFLSGAAGYTYGAGDLPPKVPQGNGAIFMWVTDPQKALATCRRRPREIGFFCSNTLLSERGPEGFLRRTRGFY